MPSYLISPVADRNKASLSQHLVQMLRDAPSATLSLHTTQPEIWKLVLPAEAADELGRHRASSDLKIVEMEGVEAGGAASDKNDEDEDDGQEQNEHEDEPHAPVIPVSVPADPTKRSLLTLPAEMRNNIYRFALVEDAQPIPIPIGTHPPNQPSLLNTCRQIRHEAAGIYFEENSFDFEINDNNAHVYIDWCSKSPRHLDAPNTNFSLEKSRNWCNTLAWLKAHWEGCCQGVLPINDGSLFDVLAYLFEVVDELEERELDWPQIESVLGLVRKALGVLDKGWLVDHGS